MSRKIDRRRHYILVVDIETANTLRGANPNSPDMKNVLVYDCGFAVVDKSGNIYERFSYVNEDIFFQCEDLMKTAYYAKKIPLYLQGIAEGVHEVADTLTIRRRMLEVMDKYRINTVAAFNCRFDLNGLNQTCRYVSRSALRFWFPPDTKFWCIMRMAKVITAMPTYTRFCYANGFLTNSGRPRKTAETLWRFLASDPEFVESHTGLEDVDIEVQIMAYCFRRHKKMVKEAFNNPRNYIEPTPFQHQIMKNLRERTLLSYV